MVDEAAEFRLVTADTPDPRFAFSVEIPTDWVRLPLPEDADDAANEDDFRPMAVFTARYGMVILTFSVRPGFGEPAVSDWLGAICHRQQLEIGPIEPVRLGNISGAGTSGSQKSGDCPMSLRVAMFEMGGWACVLMGMGPMAVWSSLKPAFDRMFSTFTVIAPLPSTVPIMPVGSGRPVLEESASFAEAASARKTAGQFLDAVRKGNKDAAKAMLADSDAESVNFNPMPEDASEYALGEARAEGPLVIVEARLRSRPAGQAEFQELNLPLVLKKLDGRWKIDMGASVNRMLGVDFEKALADMAQGLGKAMTDGLEAVMDGLAGLSEPQDGPPSPDEPSK